MKAILVIDEMPNNCYECPCFMEEGWRCQNRMDIDEDVNIGRPSWCPLKPLPQKEKQHGEEDYEYGYIDGWNDCLKEITNE